MGVQQRYFPTAVASVVATISLSLFGAPANAQTDTTIPAGVPTGAEGPSTMPAVTTTIPKSTLKVTFTGKGFGHGRGLGQWGAYGYAKDKGWNYRQILDHFYGGTVVGHVSPESALGVRLTWLDGKALTVYQPKGRVYTASLGQVGYTFPPGFAGAQSPLVVSAQATVVGAAQDVPSLTPPLLTGAPAAVRVQLVKGLFQVSDGPGCDGPWTLRAGATAAAVTVSSGPADPTVSADEPSEMLQVCEGKSRRVYRGDLLAVDGKPGQRAVNLVGLDAYVRGVVPKEVSPGWADKGLEAVKAQAVAARSYAAAERRNGFSNTCDTISCQVYGGRGKITNGQFTSYEDPRSDRAVAETAFEIRVEKKSGAPVRTEFSASSGGFSAPGIFPAVPDEGDSTTGNPNRNWTVTFPATKFEKGRKLGLLKSMEVVSRDGAGEDGGRVLKVKMTFTNGSTTVSGTELMSMLSLKSNWFSVSVFDPNPAGTVTPANTAAGAGGTSSGTGASDPNVIVVSGNGPVNTVGAG